MLDRCMDEWTHETDGQSSGGVRKVNFYAKPDLRIQQCCGIKYNKSLPVIP